ncbi:TIGR03619 family F420-dependent LLM class oxidoreductase [Actinomadura rupiterrae]|uniref:TIGR03619 family F420-dependent LLM class oxidoreductase n=2 Tax=Actinomadura rupiterrae TaxID=559627 RepID=UPI0020A33BA3|nr:TIGR03619 family F420-dependent LLM class oxidoreductase [Actinomadura rupiterrae]MCP2340759.1 putative F420-dependent oxidoreductase [Actinomadura rupiterrae]
MVRFGVLLPASGAAASPEEIVRVAAGAERAGLDSVWVQDRLLRPPGPVSYGGVMPPADPPDEWANVYDPLEVLSFVAARTERVLLGTSVIAALFQPPVVLARRVATVDRLSGGRLLVGLGQGWMAEEFEAVGVPLGRRGAGFEEHVNAMRAVWGPDPVRFEGRHYRIPESQIGPKPVRDVPVVIGAVSARAVARAARLRAGLTLSLYSWDDLREIVALYGRAAKEAGVDPADTPLVVQANGPVGETDADPGRMPLTGSPEQVASDVERLAQLGADHVYWPLGEGGVEAVARLRG